MAKCPHCGNEIELAPPARVPWWKYDPGPTANLGCGTLIVIAVIVALFSGGSSERKFNSLQRDVQKVEQAVEALGRELRERPAQPEKPVSPRDQKG